MVIIKCSVLCLSVFPSLLYIHYLYAIHFQYFIFVFLLSTNLHNTSNMRCSYILQNINKCFFLSLTVYHNLFITFYINCFQIYVLGGSSVKCQFSGTLFIIDDCCFIAPHIKLYLQSVIFLF